MKYEWQERLMKYIKDAKYKTRRRVVIGTLSFCVILLTFYVLLQPAVTLEQDSIDEAENHIHSEECYTEALICEEPEEIEWLCTSQLHAHSEDCVDSEGDFVCGYADYVVHTHDETCYEDDNQICTLDEIQVYEHTEECFDVDKELICEGETDAHEHVEECYEEVESLICEDEDEAHEHIEECFETTKELVCESEDEVHEHTEECYEEVKDVICEEEEIILHSHEESCYDKKGELSCEETVVLEHVHEDECFADAHEHTKECYEQKLSCGISGYHPSQDDEDEQTEKVEETEQTLQSQSKSVQSADMITTLSNSPATTEVAKEGITGACTYTLYYNEDRVTYTLNISGNGKMDDYSSGTTTYRPWYTQRTAITSVIIEQGVTNIGNYAFFGCSSLNSIRVPESIINIGIYAFNNCSSLSDIRISDNIISIGVSAFSGCSNLVNIDLSNVTKLESIEKSTFWNCSSLSSIIIPDSVTSIGESAFQNCKALTSITIPEGVGMVSNNTFSGCSSLTNIILPESIKSIGNSAFYNCKSLSGITLPNGVTSIGASAFNGCSALTGIKIPEGVDNIEDNTFKSCSSLLSLTLPDRVTNLGSAAFYGCSSLKDITIPEGVDNIKENTFKDCSSLLSITLPDGVTSIGNLAFNNCNSLSSITLSDGVTKIGNSAFLNCKSITSIIIPERVTNIENYTFSGCSALSSIEMGESVTNIGDYAFNGCSSLTGIHIPDSVTNIGNSAFSNCNKLEGTLLGEASQLQSIGESAFSSCSSLVGINIPESVASIGNSAFSSCSSLSGSVNIPDGVTSIGEGVFRNCGKLESVILKETSQLKNIGNNAFNNCSSLEYIDIPKNVINIGDSAFYSCGQLKSVELGEPSQLQSIGVSAFRNCRKLEKITLEKAEQLQSIGGSAFYDCSVLTSIHIPDRVTSIEKYTFNGCTKLENVLLTDASQLQSIGKSAFSGCSSLTSIHIPDGVTVIDEDAFRTCTNLRTVILGEASQLQKIKDSAFNGCRYLSGIRLPEGVTEIGSLAFNNCFLLQEIVIPKETVSIGQQAFANCKNMKEIILNAKCIQNIDETAFNGCNSFKLTIGSSVEQLNRCINTITEKIIKVSDVIFDVPNVMEVEEGVLSGLNSSLGHVSGKILIDEDGVMYWADQENNTATLIYCPQEIVEYQVPEMYEGYQITSIASYAFRKAKYLTTLTFQNPEAIETILAAAFSDCKTLTSINGESTVEGAALSFSKAKIGERAFNNTGLTDSEQNVKGSIVDKITQEVTDSVGTKKHLTLELVPAKGYNSEDSIYYSLTGEELNLRITAGATSTEETVYRVYLEYSNDSFGMSPGPDYHDGKVIYTLENGTEIEVKTARSNIPGIYYIEFGFGAGSTLQISPSVYYPNVISPGGTVNIWGEILTQEEAKELGDGVNLPTDEDEHMRAIWETIRSDFEVQKSTASGSSKVPLVGDGTESGLAYLSKDVQYSIKLEHEGSVSAFGKDNVQFVMYKDIFTLPEGMFWRPGTLEAVENGDWYVKIGNDLSYYYMYIYVSIDETEYQLAYIKTYLAESGKINGVEVSAVNDNLEFSWCIDNIDGSATVSQPITMLVSGNMLMVNLLEDEYDRNSGQTITNLVSANVTYSYTPDHPSSSNATNTIEIPDTSLTHTKTIDSSTETPTSVYREGVDLFWNLVITNTGALPNYTAEKVSDSLDNRFYITADNMQRMFEDKFGKLLKITIKNATLYNTIDLGTAIGMDGNTEVNLSPSTTDGAEATTTNIEFAWSEEIDSLIMTVGGSNVYAIGKNKEYPTIQSALDDIKFVVNGSVAYDVEWDLNDITFYGGQIGNFKIYSTIKNVFQIMLDGGYDYRWNLLEEDEELAITNQSNLNMKDGKSLIGTKKAYIRQEFRIDKSSWVEGDEKEGGMVLGDVVNYNLSIAHTGNNAYDNLPLVDDMTGGLVLLAPVEENKDAKWSNRDSLKIHKDTEGKEFYILSEPGTYEGVWVGSVNNEIQYADSVTVEADGRERNTKIKWYFTEFSGTTTKVLTYKSLVWIEPSSEQNQSTSFLLGNKVWLNDRYHDRLFDYTFDEAVVITSEKKIVVSDTYGTKEEELDIHSSISKGEEVVYKLGIKVHSYVDGKGYTLTDDDVYDILPDTFDTFEWSKDNVRIQYQEVDSRGNRSELSDTDDEHYPWTISKNDQKNRYEIHWKGFDIPENQGIYFYVFLQFPENERVWTDLLTKTNSAVNEFYVIGKPKTVTHEFQRPAMAYLQKGVVATGQTSYRTSEFYPSDNRIYYSDVDGDYGRYVIYYATIYNGGDTRLYLTDVQDKLPNGLTFHGMLNTNLSTTANYIQIGTNTSTSYTGTESDRGSNLTDVDYQAEDISYREFSVTAKKDDSANNVIFSFGQSNNSLTYDEYANMYYLQKGEAISFAYTCKVKETGTQDYEVNTIAMPYYDYSEGGVAVKEGVSAKATNVNKVMGYNDGACDIWNNDTAKSYGFDGGSSDQKWLVSQVTVSKDSIVPGVHKTAKSYINKGGAEFPYVNSVNQGDTVNWEIEYYNNSYSAMNDYIITDTMQFPYTFIGDVNLTQYTLYNQNYVKLKGFTDNKIFTIDRDGDDIIVTTNQGDSYTLRHDDLSPTEIKVKFYICRMGSPNSISTYNNVPMNLRFYLDQDGNETIELGIESNKMALSPFSKWVMSLSTVNETNEISFTSFSNNTMLIPSQSYDASRVTQGINITNDNGSNTGVLSNAAINVTGGIATGAVKSVTEKEDEENTAASDEAKNYIVLPSKDKIFTYSLSIANDADSNDKGLEELILIDNLPEVDDTTTFSDTDKRGSQFEVGFAPNPDVKVTVIMGDEITVLDPSQYTVEYSDSTNFSKDDWYGKPSAAEWTETPQVSSRSIRVIIRDVEDEGWMPAQSITTVSFDAVINGEADYGDIAWNTFGYHYMHVGDFAPLEAAPKKVGIMIPSVPKLSKSLLDSDMNEYVAKEDAVFTFLIHEGEKMDVDYTDPNAVETALEGNGVTIAELKVEAGNSVSERIPLAGLKKYKVSNGSWKEQSEPWEWESGGTYTITEVSLTDEYNFYSFNGKLEDTYTFTYYPNVNLIMNCINKRETFVFNLQKVDAKEDSEVLAGAVFGLYSVYAGDAMSDDIYNALDISADREIVNAGTTYYLMSVETTDDAGAISWEDLDQASYYLVELKAPNGYYLDFEPQVISRDDVANGVYALTVPNNSSVRLPESGGPGFGFYKIVGFLLLLLGAGLLYNKNRKRTGNILKRG